MQLNKIFKGVIIALPVVTMMACSSGPSEEELAAERNRAAEQQAEADRLAREREAEQARVQTGAAKPVMSPEEKMQKEKAELEKQQVVYFDFDRSNISAEFYPILDLHAAFLVKNPGVSVVIEGHTDSRGTPEYNIALGERRAKSVRTYLQNSGVSNSQVSVVSYGEEKPASYGSSKRDFAENRRAVVVYQ